MRSLSSSSSFSSSYSLLLLLPMVVCCLLPLLCNCLPLRQMIRTRPGMEESQSFIDGSSVLDSISADYYGSSLTLILPSNEGWWKLGQAKRDYFLNPANAEDLETLLLFSTSDHAIRMRDVQDGMIIMTLMGVEVQIDKTNNRLCMLDWNQLPLQCANVVEWDIEVDEGVVHVVDRAMLPEELDSLA
eukprot:GHVS01026907.1.p1 GENE.GHVS01026907.1~~GHVS01026907.1.p1  ORF type:complete len:187 (+),score=40.52 GHVS01026907.1:250-810(+)